MSVRVKCWNHATQTGRLTWPTGLAQRRTSAHWLTMIDFRANHTRARTHTHTHTHNAMSDRNRTASACVLRRQTTACGWSTGRVDTLFYWLVFAPRSALWLSRVDWQTRAPAASVTSLRLRPLNPLMSPPPWKSRCQAYERRLFTTPRTMGTSCHSLRHHRCM